MSILTSDLKEKFETLLTHYPADQRQAAVIPILHLAQAKAGLLTADAQQEVADYIGIPVSKVHEVVSFYTMLSEKPRGRNHMLVCKTLPCELTGCSAVIKAVHDKLGLNDGQVSADGKFSLEVVECLARCGEGPVMQVGEEVFTELTPEKTAQVIDQLAKRP